jgi:hypothetical protein
LADVGDAASIDPLVNNSYILVVDIDGAVVEEFIAAAAAALDQYLIEIAFN